MNKPYLNCGDWHCNNCDEIVYLGEWETDTTKPNYCSNCGKKLHWVKEKESKDE